ncbi:MAG: hypothetical protein O7E52_29710 [Candidatus Poribacteria bacterium]|nr:hypothetical protein [Candidatus Poribacteria bacterium]
MLTQTKLKQIVLAVSLVLLVFGGFSIGAEIRNPFSVHMKRAELIFIGTLVNRQYVPDEASPGNFFTDLTFHVDGLIEGTPNIDEKTVTFSIPGGEGIVPSTGKYGRHWSSMGQTFAKLEKGDNVLMLLRENPAIATWMPRYNGLYPISESHGCWFVKAKKENEKVEYTVFMWASSKDRLKQPFLGLPLPLVVRFINTARKHPEQIDPLTDIIADAIVDAISDGLPPDGPDVLRIHRPLIARIQRVLDELEAADAQAEVERR